MTTSEPTPAVCDARCGGDEHDHGHVHETSRAAGEPVADYRVLLREHGFAWKDRGPWAVVGESEGVQGWKLHLSSVQIEAPRLLRVVLALLRERGVSFKIARDSTVVAQLNEGDLGATQIGKVVTIYPRASEVVELARELARRTAGHAGPIIPTDLRLGDVVYARHGCFNPLLKRDRLGQVQLFIEGEDGSVRRDDYRVPFELPPGVANPFEGMEYRPEPVEHRPLGTDVQASKLFGPGYLVVDVLKQHPKGSVFLAIDLRSQKDVSLKVLKQGRQHCLSDDLGRDMRTRLKRQETLHRRLSQVIPAPDATSYFEVSGDGYLCLEHIEGQTIEAAVHRRMQGRPWTTLSDEDRRKLLAWAGELAGIVSTLHRHGYVHRDLTASNVWIGADDRVHLLDLELAHEIGDDTPAFGLGTPGFMSPNQARRGPPELADDVFGMGAVMILLLTGLDPRRVLFVEEARRAEVIRVLTGGAPRSLAGVVAAAVSEDASNRPDMAALRRAIEEAARGGAGQRVEAPPAAPSIGEIVARGTTALLGPTMSDPESGLWLSLPMTQGEGRRSSTLTYDIRRSMNRGVAGTVYALARLARSGHRPQGMESRVARAVEWLLADEHAPDAGMPGLHFGDAGVAVALAEAVSSGLAAETDAMRDFFARVVAAPIDWPDITHGAAGQGLAAFLCGDLLPGLDFSPLARRAAEYLIERQAPDGSWAMPEGVDGMTGETLTGFGHGVAGMVYYLAEYAHRTGDAPAREAAERGADWLLRQATTDAEGVPQWKYSDRQEAVWRWWCHGAPGIALTFLRLFEHTGRRGYLDVALSALRAHPAELRYPNQSQCHGLSGMGEAYLEAFRVTRDAEWAARARAIADVLLALRFEHAGSCLWAAENPEIPTADLMVGSAGVLHFLLRLDRGPESLAAPLLPACGTRTNAAASSSES